MEYLRKHPAPVLAIIGAIVAVQSIAWEYARVKPDYRFLVEPWSVRGYELVQGKVIATIGICIAFLVVIAWRDVAGQASLPTSAVGAAFIGVTIGIAAIAGTDWTFTMGPSAALILSFAVGIISGRFLKYTAGQHLEGANYQLLVWGTPFALAAIFYFAIAVPLLIDEAFTQPVWLIATIVVVPLVLLALLGQPRELATNRLLILAILGGWGYATMSAGAVRTTLLGLQEEVSGVAAQYKDLQITSGMILAFIALGIAFLGGVAMWAQRRDQLIALKRAQQQRDAAAKSAAELADALELLEPEYR